MWVSGNVGRGAKVNPVLYAWDKLAPYRAWRRTPLSMLPSTREPRCSWICSVVGARPGRESPPASWSDTGKGFLEKGTACLSTQSPSHWSPYMPGQIAPLGRQAS